MEYQNNVSLGKKFTVVRDPVLSGPEEMQTLTWRVGSEYITFPYCIASCNTFLKKADDCVPAEIGMTKLSFQDGILEKYHALIDPSGTIPDHELPDVIEFSDHEIPYYATNIFPDIKKVVADIYAFTHTYDVNGKKTAYIFAEFDEMDKIRCTFKWFETMSNMHQLNLAWKINFISLRTLYQFLLSHIPVTNLDDSDAFSAFKKGSLYDYTDLCDFHLYLKDCRFCAISQAFIYCYILSEHFSKPFGVAPLGRVTFTGSFLKYEKDL